MFRVVVLAALVAGCVAEGDALVDEALAPPGSLTLTISPLVPGGPATFEVRGGPARRTVHFARASAVHAGCGAGAAGWVGLGGAAGCVTGAVGRAFRSVALECAPVLSRFMVDPDDVIVESEVGSEGQRGPGPSNVTARGRWWELSVLRMIVHVRPGLVASDTRT